MSQIIEEMYEYMSVWRDRGAAGMEKEFLIATQEAKTQLEGRLDAGGRELLNKLVRAYEDWADIREPQIFKEGFQMGMSVAEECATE